MQQWNFSFILCVTEFQLRPLSLVCIKWGVHVAKQELILSDMVLVTLKESTFLETSLIWPKCLSESRTSHSAKLKLLSTTNLRLVAAFFSCHCDLNFEQAKAKTNDHRNEPLFQWHLICLARSSLQDARSSAFTLLNQFPYTQGRNVVVWLI